MDQTSRKSKRAKSICCVCGVEQKNQSEKFRSCSGCKEKLGTRRYFCSRYVNLASTVSGSFLLYATKIFSACQKTDWKTHRERCGSQDFWDYPHKPLLAAEANFERPTALRCQISLIDSSPDVLYNIAPGTDVGPLSLFFLV